MSEVDGIKERMLKVETDITSIRVDIEVMKVDVKHIVEKLEHLCCLDHSRAIFDLEKKTDRVVTVWATISGAIVLCGTILAMVAHLRGIF